MLIGIINYPNIISELIDWIMTNYGECKLYVLGEKYAW